MNRNAILMKPKNPLRTVFRQYSEKDDQWYKVTRIGIEVTKVICAAPNNSQIVKIFRERLNNQQIFNCSICGSENHKTHNCQKYLEIGIIN